MNDGRVRSAALKAILVWLPLATELPPELNAAMRALALEAERSDDGVT